MLLRDWLSENNLNYTDAAKRFGATRTSVMYYATGKQRPNGEMTATIQQITNGAVMANDHQLAWRLAHD